MKIISIIILICLALYLTTLIKQTKKDDQSSNCISPQNSSVGIEKTIFLEDGESTMVWYGDADAAIITSFDETYISEE